MNRHCIAGILGAIAISLGAFGAHGLKSQLNLIPQATDWWETATFYLLVHSVAILAVPHTQNSNSKAHWILWATGSALFAGTLYAMALGAPRWLGAITPIGGTMLIAGWGIMAWNARQECIR